MLRIRMRLLGFPRLVLAAAGSFVAVLATPDQIGVPLREVQVRAAFLAVGAFTALAPMTLTSPLDVLERSAARSAHRGWFERCLAIGLISLGVASAGFWAPMGVVVAARNVALLFALAVVSATVLPLVLVWLPSALVLTVSFVFGLQDIGTPRRWALLLHGPTAANLTAAAVALVSATALFVVRGPHQGNE